jgi:hypothetical protein
MTPTVRGAAEFQGTLVRMRRSRLRDEVVYYVVEMID